MTKPIIGIIPDYEESGEYAPIPWYALRENYISSITQAGGIPLIIPYETDFIIEYLSRINGLLITGGNFDINPEIYGNNETHETVNLKNKRTNFEIAITKKAFADKMPILGICGGEQLINVVLGGTLIQHIPDEIDNALEHEQKNPRHEPSHEISIKEGTLLHKIVGQSSLQVNSSHHQAVKDPGNNLIINATAPDGVVEGIEATNHPFCLGVEWHPEYHTNDGDSKILEAFVDAAAR